MNNIERFEELLTATGREGVDELLSFIRKSDFYTAPASTKFHSCHEGGLLEHSLCVFDCLIEKTKSDVWSKALDGIDTGSLAIAALLHDICKTYCYSIELKNKKVYSDNGYKSDSNGRFDWQSVPSYTFSDKMPLGHGEKSIIMISKYIELTKSEMYAIRWHMGFSEPKENWNSFTSSIRMHPLVLALHEADLEASHILEENS